MFCASYPALETLGYSQQSQIRMKLGLKGFEPLTLRLSSACSNQLSYRPVVEVK